ERAHMSKIRIVLGDDHTLVRQGVRKILEDQPDWTVVDEASDGREAVRKTLEAKPDVAIFDIAMPLLHGIEATRQGARRAPDVRVLVPSVRAEEAHLVQGLQAGAMGCLVPDPAVAAPVGAAAAVASGKSFFSPAVTSVMLDD